MKKISVQTVVHTALADLYTPVGIYLRLRDRFRDTVLLESSDSHAADNSWSFIGINAVAGIEVQDFHTVEYKLPLEAPKRVKIGENEKLDELLWDFMQRFECSSDETSASFGKGLYGYSCFETAAFGEKLDFQDPQMPLARYRLYQYVIAINHHRDELLLIENRLDGLQSEMDVVESLIRNRDVPQYPFAALGEQQANMTDAAFLQLVDKGRASCFRGDVFQVVLSRSYSQAFNGDDFNVYRALRHINPSPYLFYFDYGDYRLMGSSPEAQLVISGRKAVMHPIAGTFRRTGDEGEDRRRAAALLDDAKENAEHVMLVDLARNDLSTVCEEVTVTRFREVQYYSHVIHLVSEVSGQLPPAFNPFTVLARSFPAGTLSGAPKIRAMELIASLEPTPRGFYGGAIGFVGFDGSCNKAIMIRSLLSRDNTLRYQAGAGVVAASDPQSELQEVDNKLNALKKAVVMAAGMK